MSDDENRLRRILVIDDNVSIHEDFGKTLAKKKRAQRLLHLGDGLFDDDGEPPPSMARRDAMPMEFELAFATQGEQGARMVAEAQAEGRPFSLAFVDMRMPPGWDGVETIKHIWDVDPGLQCVICTAYSDYSWEDILRELGVSDSLLLLRKPFDAAEVCQLACALTEKWHLARRAHLKLEQLQGMVEEQTRQLAESEARYALAAAGANDGLWDWTFASEQLFFSARWSSLLGLPPEPATADLAQWFERVHPDDLPALREDIDALRSGQDDQLWIEYRMRHEDGQYRWMLCRGAISRDAEGRPTRAAGSQTDITNRKMAEAQLRHDAQHDALTSLPNRALVTERIEACIARQRREPSFRFAVLFIDLDRFKVINDSLGHVVGDALLVALAERLTSSVRSTDTTSRIDGRVGRLGGDEFVVLLEGIHSDSDAVSVAERLLANAARPIHAAGHVIRASLSIGIALGKPTYDRVDDILRDADTALYRAKADGRGRYDVFTEELHTQAVQRWQTETELREAIERQELELYYQPIVSLADGGVSHFEALVRWRHPKRGMISPAEFIPLAEESGLIVRLGAWVLGEACRQARRWRERGVMIPIAVNVASRQFAEPNFVADVKDALAAEGLPPEAIQLEVTEGSTMHHRAVETCAELAAMGVLLGLDDFGTGYSSLSYLTRLPIYALKIDRSFVARMAADPMSASIVRTVLTLASSLGIRAIAEGVESAAELELLRQMGCGLAQGFHWSRPVPPEDALSFATSTAARDAA